MNQEDMLIESSPQGLGIITFNRPEQHNAFDDQMIQKLTQQLIIFEKTPHIKVVMLKANGKNFSAGADLAWMKKTATYDFKENLTDALTLVELLKTLFNLSKPTIALAKGLTMGGGIGLLACCDIVIAEANASFCFSEAKLGLIPATIAPYIINAIGAGAANYYFLTAEFFSAQTAQKIGLVHEIVEEKELEASAAKKLTSLLRNGPKALQEIKKLTRKWMHYDENRLNETAELIAKIRLSNEAQEGLSAFFEKRLPHWAIKNSDG